MNNQLESDCDEIVDVTLSIIQDNSSFEYDSPSKPTNNNKDGL